MPPRKILRKIHLTPGAKIHPAWTFQISWRDFLHETDFRRDFFHGKDFRRDFFRCRDFSGVVNFPPHKVGSIE